VQLLLRPIGQCMSKATSCQFSPMIGALLLTKRHFLENLLHCGLMCLLGPTVSSSIQCFPAESQPSLKDVTLWGTSNQLLVQTQVQNKHTQVKITQSQQQDS
jgi:hypothetical protein